MLFGLFKKPEEPIRIILNQSSGSASEIEYIAPHVGDIEIVWFLLLIYTRMYKNCSSFFKTYKDDLNNSFKDIPKNSSFESMEYELVTSQLIEIYNIGESLNKNTKMTLQKGKTGYSIFVGDMATKNPNLYFHCANLLLLPKIKDQIKYLNCLIELANKLNNKSISVMDGIELPKRILANHYKFS